MKKVAAFLSAIVLAALMTIPASAAGFTPSVEQKESPSISTVTDASGNSVSAIIRDADGNEVYGVSPDNLIVTPLSAAGQTNDAAGAMLASAYEQLQTANTLADIVPSIGDFLTSLGSEAAVEDLGVRDIFDVSVTGDAAEYLAEDGNGITLRFDLKLSPSALLIVLHNYSGSDWEIIPEDRVVQNADGTVDVTFESLSPIAFVVDNQESEENNALDTAAPVSPQTSDNGQAPIGGIFVVVLGCAAVFTAVILWKKYSRS